MFDWLKDKFKKKETDIKEEIQETEEKVSENIIPDDDANKVITEDLEKNSVLDKDVKDVKDIEEKSASYEKISEYLSEKVFEEEKSHEEENNESLEIEKEEAEENIIEDLKDNLDTNKEKLENVEVEEKPNKIEEEINSYEKPEFDEEIVKEDLVQEETIEEELTEESKKTSLFQRLKEGLDKTRKEVGIKINTVIGAYVKIDDEMLEDLEDILISADVGMETTMKLIDNLRETIIREKIKDPKEVKPLLMEEAKKLMNPELNTKIISEAPVIILVVGVNGVGKTTTIGKLSQRFKGENKSVLVCAADTFRAAAIDQLKEWGNRANVDVISHDEGSDPAAVVFDAIEAAKARKTDVLIVDTAGRLHNKSNLMKELEKINRIITNKYPEANRENLLVLDSTTGQNAINQAKTFKEVTDVTAIALTKLDGTAKGGVVIALQSELGIPIKLIGVGEGIDDLQDFNINTFLETIFG
ncbi:signal recognition particle-docking protein FtsY [Peptoniphilus sp.]|uniref:signal recognition particle-docking protein FtsY n=1 Tax=Peptoniphilus sp. TaxID=1971214 RepID=UPI002A7F8B51|nr:signal recognition particle-docking protein FtsY [Peptoniphilus sp.]MDY3903088.1 signal recognition particle-docking protein FtsY [Peptoniphilus sp.]